VLQCAAHGAIPRVAGASKHSCLNMPLLPENNQAEVYLRGLKNKPGCKQNSATADWACHQLVREYE
jgi:hypothetical protein